MSRSMQRAVLRAFAASIVTCVVLASERVAAKPPLPVIQDCADCPEMVVLPPGRFVMGSSQRERSELGVPALFDRMESPQHAVRIARSFAISRHAVTFAQWDACVAAGGCDGYRPSDEGWGRGTRPVIHVNWADTQSYLRWLSERTGRNYRLPSEAEWEYAARAGTRSYYYFGNRIDHSHANYDSAGGTMPVGSFAPNRFGLYDMTGNVAQWVQDCHHDSYEGAPSDGSAWLADDCRLRNVRGGAWSLHGWSVRTAQRIGDPVAMRNNHLGFRVAVDVPVAKGQRAPR